MHVMKRIVNIASMKVFLTALLFSTSALCVGQKGFYLKGSIGQAWGINNHYFSWGQADFEGDVPAQPMVDRRQIGNTIQENVKEISYGKGRNISVGMGYMVTDRVGFQLDMVYLEGNKVIASTVFPGLKYTSVNTTKAQMFSLNPTFVISMGNEGVTPYARIGALIGIPTIRTNIIINSGGTVIDYEDRVHKNIARGLLAAGGIKYRLGGLSSIFAEFVFSNVNYEPGERDVRKYNEGGNDILAKKYPDPKTDLIKEVSSFDVFPNGNKHLTQSLPFGSFGFNVGMVFKFGEQGLPRGR